MCLLSNLKNKTENVSLLNDNRDDESVPERLLKLTRKCFLETSAANDIPRLIKRICIISEQGTLFPCSITNTHETSSAFDKEKLVRLFVNTLAGYVEPQKMDIIENVFESHIPCDRECKKWLPFFQDLTCALTEKSLTLQILKYVNQSVILYGYEHLYRTLCRDLTLKDVRGPTGWRIQIQFLRHTFHIVHQRREQAFVDFGDMQRSFEFEWEIRLVFDKNMNALQSATLLLGKTYFPNNIDEETKLKVQQTFIEGLHIAL